MRKTTRPAGATWSDVQRSLTPENALEQLEYWMERSHTAERAGDTEQMNLAERLVQGYTFFLANLDDNDPV